MSHIQMSGYNYTNMTVNPYYSDRFSVTRDSTNKFTLGYNLKNKEENEVLIGNGQFQIQILEVGINIITPTKKYSLVGLLEKIDTIEREHAVLTEHLNDMEVILEKLYFSPGMPGEIEAKSHFIESLNEMT